MQQAKDRVQIQRRSLSAITLRGTDTLEANDPMPDEGKEWVHASPFASPYSQEYLSFALFIGSRIHVQQSDSQGMLSPAVLKRHFKTCLDQ